MVRKGRPQKKERAQIKLRERQTHVVKSTCHGGRAKILRRLNGSYYWSRGLVDVESWDTNVFLNSLLIFKNAENGKLHLEEVTWDEHFDRLSIPEIINHNQIEEEILEDAIEKELDEALSILKDNPNWRENLDKALDKFYQNSNVLLDLERPLMTPFRRALIGSLRWLNREQWILVKRRRIQFTESSFKWIKDLPPSCKVVNLLVLKRVGLRGFKLQPIPEEFDLEFLLRKHKQEFLFVTSEEEEDIEVKLNKLQLLEFPWTDHLDSIENSINKYEPAVQIRGIEEELIDF